MAFAAADSPFSAYVDAAFVAAFLMPRGFIRRLRDAVMIVFIRFDQRRQLQAIILRAAETPPPFLPLLPPPPRFRRLCC